MRSRQAIITGLCLKRREEHVFPKANRKHQEDVLQPSEARGGVFGLRQVCPRADSLPCHSPGRRSVYV